MRSLIILLVATQASAAGLTRGPYLQLADATGITVVFRTDAPSIGTALRRRRVVIPSP